MTKIYSVTHKEVEKYADGRTVIGVGPNKNIKCVSLYDNTGRDNISDKNDYYCELTALYWIWKNTDDDIVGLEHYRRIFCKENLFSFRPLTIEEMQKILKKYDVIVPEYSRMKKLKRLYDRLGINHNMQQKANVYTEYKCNSELDFTKEIIGDLYPAYIKDFDKVMNDDKAHFCNMFVAKKSFIDGYCEWLFNILFEYEKRVNQENQVVRPRMYGFLSERLFNVWLEHQHVKKYCAEIRGFESKPKYVRWLKRLFGK